MVEELKLMRRLGNGVHAKKPAQDGRSPAGKESEPSLVLAR